MYKVNNDELKIEVEVYADENTELLKEQKARILFNTILPKSDKEININPVSGISLDPSEVSIIPGQVISVIVKQTPFTSNLPNLVWESKDPNIVSIINNNCIKGINLGTTSVTVTDPIDNSITATLTVTVESPSNMSSPEEGETVPEEEVPEEEVEVVDNENIGDTIEGESI